MARNRALNRLRNQRRRAGGPLLLDDRLDTTATGDLAEHADLDGFGDDHLRLVSTLVQRISRAKQRLRAQRARFELPAVAELPVRLGAVLEAIYLIFNQCRHRRPAHLAGHHRASSRRNPWP